MNHGFVAKGVLFLQKSRVEIGSHGFQSASGLHRAAVRGEIVERGFRRSRMEGLDGGSEGGAFRALHRDDGIAEHIGEDLTPGKALAAAACETDFRGGETQGLHAPKSIGHAESDALHHRAGDVRGRDI